MRGPCSGEIQLSSAKPMAAGDQLVVKAGDNKKGRNSSTLIGISGYLLEMVEKF